MGNNLTAPVLIPIPPEQFWAQIRLIVREELATLQSQQKATPDTFTTPGLTFKPLYKMEEVCRLFQVTRQTIYDWSRRGKLNPVKVGARVYFLHTDLSELVPLLKGS